MDWAPYVGATGVGAALLKALQLAYKLTLGRHKEDAEADNIRAKSDHELALAQQVEVRTVAELTRMYEELLGYYRTEVQNGHKCEEMLTEALRRISVLESKLNAAGTVLNA